MGDFDVILYGTDTSGRGVYMTKYMRAWWERVVEDLGFEPTIVQGAFMTRNGGGASDSAGYHDQGGCLDLRTWDRTADELEQMVRTLRRFGAAAWRRDVAHGGMDPHLHFVLGTDQPLDSGAAYQWRQYLAGRDGLASNGSDYEWRPDPLVTEPPQEDPMADYAGQLDAIESKIDALAKAEKEREKRDRNRAANLRVILKERFNATDADLDEILGRL